MPWPAALAPLARIVAHATHSPSAGMVHHRAGGAIQKLLAKAGWNVGRRRSVRDQRGLRHRGDGADAELGIAHDKVNVNGGACALGHPIGASGARLMVTLIHALQAHGLQARRRGLCIGGGEATAVAVDLPERTYSLLFTHKYRLTISKDVIIAPRA